jgi:pimeloyl-ACP methyl ester carboxylesterase
MRQSTEGLRTVILDSTVPPDVDPIATIAAYTARSLEQVRATCQAPNLCDAMNPTFIDRLDSLVDKLNASPLTLIVSGANVSFTGDDLLYLVRALLYSPSGIAILPLFLWELEQNAISLDMLLESLAKNQATIADAMHLSVACREWAPRTTDATLAMASMGVDPRIVSAFDPKKSYLAECPVWGVPAAPAELANPVIVDTPTLVLAGSYDPATPPEWGQRVANALPHAQFVLFQGGAHGETTLDCGGTLAATFLDVAGPIADPICPEHDDPISFALPTLAHLRPLARETWPWARDATDTSPPSLGARTRSWFTRR